MVIAKIRDWLGISTLHECVDSLNASTKDLAESVIQLQRDFETMTNAMLKHKQRIEELERSQASSHRQLLAQTIALHDVLSGEDPEMYYQVIGRARNYRSELDRLDNPTLAITQWLTGFKDRVA